MERKVSWGILGTAQIGINQVIPAMQKGTNTSVSAIASRNAFQARTTAQALGIPNAYGSYEELLADPAIEAIYNPLPNHLHVPWTIKALEAGKHVLCEKPIALTAADAEQIVNAMRRTGRLAAEAFMVRHHPQWERAKDLTESRRIGTVRAVQATFSYHLTDPANIRNQADIGGGGLYDIGCYAINTARYIFGSEPERVVGLFDRDPMLRTDRMMSGLADFGEGRHLVFTCATQLTLSQRVQILGTAGRIEIEIPFNAPNDRPTSIIIDDGRDLTGSGREVIAFPQVDQYTRQGDCFSRAVLGMERLKWDATDAVLNMRVIDAYFRSEELGTWQHP